jgi:hypothetical protein
MKLDRRLILVGALVVAIGVAVYLRGSPSQDSPEHRVGSDAGNGTSALKQLAEALGHPTVTLQDGFTPDLGMRVLFVFTPRTGFTKQEAQRLADYASGGGVVVYASEDGDPQLDATLHVERQSTLVSGDGTAAGPMLSGVQHVSGGAAVRPLVPHTRQVVVLRGVGGQPIGIEELVGRGRIVTLTDPLPLCNGYLGAVDNGRLASDLVSLAGGGGSVAFDEYHHQVAGPISPVTAWLSTSWGASATWAVVLLFIGLLLRGRAFGPRLELPGGGDRSSAEYVAAVGQLLQRSRAVGVTAEVLREAARRAVAQRHGIGATGAFFERSLAQRAPQEAHELAAAEAELAAAGREETLLSAARRLRAVAYPDPHGSSASTPSASSPSTLRGGSGSGS